MPDPASNNRKTMTDHANDGAETGHRLASLALVPKGDDKLSTKDFKSDQEVRWCPGCGDYAILAAFQSFLPELEIPRENLAIISGIGCSSRLPYYVNSYGMHSIHGRAPALATGLASSRPDLSVWVITGDGDALSIGGNHLIHALRRNVNIKILLFNNRIYGLTKGQYSPTSEQGKVTKSTPFGSLDTPFNPVSLALGAEASFVARTIDSDRKHLTSVLRAAADHRGAAFVEIYQNCPIFNDDAFIPLTSPATREDTVIRLEDGAPVRFGPDQSRGLRFNRTGSLEVVDANAFALSRLDTVDFAHTPIGVLRQAVRPSYDELMADQIAGAREKQGEGDLAALLAGSDTWQVG
jgi:2-oxoglutarate/2-oxoacid ferredoxin oxidoreductase subunit beta